MVDFSEVVFTDRELDLMNVLWEYGPSTAAEVQMRLADTVERAEDATL